MTEEIKEMLHCIEMNCKHNKCFGGVKLDEEDCKLLLDYITNLQEDYQEQYTYEYNLRKQLQQENERLKEKLENKLTPEELVNMLNQELVRQNKCYKSRCEKAIEDIQQLIDNINNKTIIGLPLFLKKLEVIQDELIGGSDENE